MSANNAFHIAVLPGDGIGHEVMRPCLDLLEASAKLVGGLSFRFEQHAAGAVHFRDTGVALPRAALDASRTPRPLSRRLAAVLASEQHDAAKSQR